MPDLIYSPSSSIGNDPIHFIFLWIIIYQRETRKGLKLSPTLGTGAQDGGEEMEIGPSQLQKAT